MTKEEAIQILSTRDAHGVLCGYTSGVTEALDMAIEALSVDEQMQSIVEKRVAELVHLNYELEQQLADRPRGEWIIDTYNMELKCGVCGETFRFDDVDEVLDYMEYAKYCLACGAKMGGDIK